jgi:cytidylate kinase
MENPALNVWTPTACARAIAGGRLFSREGNPHRRTSAAVPHVAAVPKAREWMVKRQRECLQFGNLVMEGRDIGTNVFPGNGFQVLPGCPLAERTRRRAADGVRENLAARDQRDSQRAVAPLMIPLGREGHQQFKHDVRTNKRADHCGRSGNALAEQ